MVNKDIQELLIEKLLVEEKIEEADLVETKIGKITF